MALNVLISEYWWLVWGVIHLLNVLSVLKSALGPALAMM